MSSPSLALGMQPTPVVPRSNCRVSERHACDVHTSCQPPSFGSGAEEKWDGTIRNISTGGISLVLSRRFERGAGLAIELPGPAQSATVLARVIHVKPQPDGGWMLGCAFVSPLSDEELRSLLKPGPREPRPAPPVKRTLAEVYLRGTLPEGVVIERLIRRLDLPKTWPLKAGQVLGIKTNGKGAPPVVRMRVDFCGKQGGTWALHVTFLDATPVDILRAFGPSYPVRC